MPRGAAEVADVFRRYGDAYRQQHGTSLSTAQRRVMTAIEGCRTAALVGLQPTGSRPDSNVFCASHNPEEGGRVD